MEEWARNLEPTDDIQDAMDRGVRALMRAAAAGMTYQDKLDARETYLRDGCPRETLDKLFPDLPPLTS